MSVNNVCFRWEDLQGTVNRFRPVDMEMGNVPPAGHAFERAIFVYCLLQDIPCYYAEDVLDHFQLNSHATQKFEKDTATAYRGLAKNVFSSEPATGRRKKRWSFG